MGERGNIEVEGVWFYTHWRGYETHKIVQKALQKKERWADTPYLRRIIFQELIGDEEGTTGFGIDTTIGDSDYPTTHIKGNTVSVGNKEWSFEEFIKLKLPDEIEELEGDLS